MKNLIVMALAGVALSYAAKYFKITSFEQVKKLVPDLKNIVPQVKKTLAYS
ncbi:MAG: hypothetical protein V4565_13605 [Bacteroidota bacterium]